MRKIDRNTITYKDFLEMRISDIKNAIKDYEAIIENTSAYSGELITALKSSLTKDRLELVCFQTELKRVGV